MRRLLFSPHPDDAVWSCGGVFDRWTAGGRSLTVVTVFDGDGERGVSSGASGTPSVRRAEDARALGRWPLARISLGLPDAAERRADDGRRLYAGPLALRRTPHPDDGRLSVELTERVAPLLSGFDQVLLPLAQHTHVDHLITRQAIERALEHRSTPLTGSVGYYAEFPYTPPPPSGFDARDEPAEFGPWLRAALDYESQVQAMFGTVPSFARALARHTGAPDRCMWRHWTRSAAAQASV